MATNAAFPYQNSNPLSVPAPSGKWIDIEPLSGDSLKFLYRQKLRAREEVQRGEATQKQSAWAKHNPQVI